MLTDNNINALISARHALHTLAEPAHLEKRTKAFLMGFLSEHTHLTLADMGEWFYAVHYEKDAKTTVAVRADFDAVPAEDGSFAHRCGHDGHSAALLGLALELEGLRVGKNVILLFQHAEETGEGAGECCKLFELESVDEVIGCHNIPQKPLGCVLVRKGTFACASCGMTVSLTGKPTHAAYPENGINPTEALAELALALPQIIQEEERRSNLHGMATVVGMRSGEKAFGVAAADAELWVTLRTQSTEELQTLISDISAAADKSAARHCLKYSIALSDVFTATVNNDACVEKLMRACASNDIPVETLPQPFRWSEDFGKYLEQKQGVFFGIGAGEATKPLHTCGYEYPDGLLVPTINAFVAYLMQ